ncbi:DUF1992 domain-containing protein [Jannaschia sp. Os4]|uniref:DnaJ family domain-containing protein n=1 Tax=Jannaschia sp. Os4 TaxID=2807617 RepID=UPI0019399269|nr:DnaJ family domain-containing protein [Jannaschia sp. Os4]MBM2574836.1 DUF1992 domain-containing protein [Jannaschia sp. Os4]
MSFLGRMAERMLQRRADEGGLEGLAGEGKPLPAQQVDPFVDPVDAAGYKMMAKAGAVPEEVTLTREVSELWRQVRVAEGEEKRRLQLRLAELDMRRNMAREARVRLR